MAEEVEKTKQGHKMQLHTTEPGKNQEVFTPQDLLCGLLMRSVHGKQFGSKNLFDNCDCQNLVL